MKKILIFIWTLTVLICGCSRRNTLAKAAAEKNLKVGFIFNGNINDRSWTQAQNAGRLALEREGVQTMYVENVPETEVSIIAMKELVRQGCKVVFAADSGYSDYVIEAARDFPEVKFEVCAGSKTADNVSCYAGKMFEARYLAGIVAGLKTTANRIGYIAAYKTPEYIREINAFTLGVKSVNPDANVVVSWTESLNNPTQDKYIAEQLLIFGCDVLTQQLNSTVINSIAEEKGAFVIGSNYPDSHYAADAYLTSVCYEWDVFVLDEIKNYLEDKWHSRFYWEGLSSGIVRLGPLSKLCVPGTKMAVGNAEKKLLSGELNIFAGPVYDMNQNLKIEEGSELDLLDVWNMNWFVEGVQLINF